MSQDNNQVYEVTYEETTFWGLLKDTGINAFLNWSFLYSLILTGACGVLIRYKNHEFIYELTKSVAPALLGAAATIFGIVLAALAVSISLFHHSLFHSLLTEKLLHKYLFPFWKAVSMWGISVVLNLVIIIVVAANFNIKYLFEILFLITFFLFVYATFYTVKLTGLIIRLTLQRAQIKMP